MRVSLHPEARDELRLAAIWYDERRPGLGDELLGEVTAAFRRVGDGPGSFPNWPGLSQSSPPIRRALADRFPYAVAFEVYPTRVLVLAVAHTRRKPLYWLARVGPSSKTTSR